MIPHSEICNPQFASFCGDVVVVDVVGGGIVANGTVKAKPLSPVNCVYGVNLGVKKSTSPGYCSRTELPSRCMACFGLE